MLSKSAVGPRIGDAGEDRWEFTCNATSDGKAMDGFVQKRRSEGMWRTFFQVAGPKGPEL
ncbi:hypothetical protein GCM10009755_04300 [Brevibacterium samyangense]|uniref:Uncharacterized protein n=1 Tax=Brevibacterium samyangense TaxID=366888 RepID=A0ABN2T856_9MICO